MQTQTTNKHMFNKVNVYNIILLRW